MLPNQIKKGLKCYTRISSEVTTLVEVVADEATGTKRYRIKRLDTGAILRKLRGPGELHMTPGPWTRAASTYDAVLDEERAAHKAGATDASTLPESSTMKVATRGPGRPRGLAKAVATGLAQGAAKVPTMQPSQVELLKKLVTLPDDTRQFLSDLIDSIRPPTEAPAPASHPVKRAG